MIAKGWAYTLRIDWFLNSVALVTQSSEGIINSIISKKLIKAYNGYDSDAVKYVEKVKELLDKSLDRVKLEDVRAIREKVKFPCKLDISVFYQLTGRLPH